jgi:hypothetical protein
VELKLLREGCWINAGKLVESCQTVARKLLESCPKTAEKLPGSCQSLFAGSFLAAFWQLYRNYLETLWQHSGNFPSNFLATKRTRKC